MLDVCFAPFPALEASRLDLRELREDDSQALFRLRNDPQVLRYLGREPEASVEQTNALIHRIDRNRLAGEGLLWGMSPRPAESSPPDSPPDSPPALWGAITLWRIDKVNHQAEVGYMLHPAQWGRGLMGEAMQVVLKYGFEVVQLHRVEAHARADNLASHRLLERAGFSREGLLRQSWHFRGEFHDSVLYAKLRSDE